MKPMLPKNHFHFPKKGKSRPWQNFCGLSLFCTRPPNTRFTATEASVLVLKIILSSAQIFSLSSTAPEPHLAELFPPPKLQISTHHKGRVHWATLLPLPMENMGPPSKPHGPLGLCHWIYWSRGTSILIWWEMLKQLISKNSLKTITFTWWEPLQQLLLHLHFHFSHRRCSAADYHHHHHYTIVFLLLFWDSCGHFSSPTFPISPDFTATTASVARVQI